MSEVKLNLTSSEGIVLDRYPELVKIDEREGYQGLLVEAGKLLELLKFLRDELGYDHLTSLTGVDYFPEQYMEVVYHLFKSTGGEILEIKVQIPREKPVVPSVYDLYPGANFQEREAWDLLGIRFEGHPDLKRILMWEGFEGHPLQKDWQEVYYGDQVKPYEDRWPEGKPAKIELKNPYQENIRYPDGFNPGNLDPGGG